MASAMTMSASRATRNVSVFVNTMSAPDGDVLERMAFRPKD